jgi:crotonobetainyl-CoA:carnitine CoA-transferase CaiB-like acyl-CoA transferase
MRQGLCAGIRVLDLGDDAAARAARIFADLGADVVRVVPPSGDPLAGHPAAELAWTAGTRVAALAADDPVLERLLQSADVVFDTPQARGMHAIDPGRAPQAVWVSVTPFGLTGPRSAWHASDLGVMAASGNMFATGHPERPPVRASEPTSHCHTGPEAAYAALTALACGRAGVVDLSMQEAVVIANMSGQAAYPSTGDRGRRSGSSIGRAREIWRTKDGWVSFALRGGKARIPTLELLARLTTRDGIAGAEVLERDWSLYNANTVTEDELRAIEGATAEYFSRHTTNELFEIACEHNWMLAPITSPREIVASKQLVARDFFRPVGDVERFPASFVAVSTADGSVAPAAPSGPARRVGREVAFGAGGPGAVGRRTGAGAWAGTRILEFGSGAAGPIASRYFVEQGATVLRVESATRPDFLRVYALGPGNPHGLEGSSLFDALNVGKRDVTLNLKHPDAVAMVKRLVVEWADAVSENFAPRAMKGFGLDYESLVALKPELVMISACLNGQTGPYRDYPGFGTQGAALSGFTFLTGWPDLDPVGPYGTITDSLAPRYVAVALAAGLLYRRRTGRGVYLDVSQVECGIWSLAPWIIDYSHGGVVGERRGNRSPLAVPHGAFPCADEGVGDRWVAIACWSDDDWVRLAAMIGVHDPSLATLHARFERVDEIEAMVAAWTSSRSRLEVAERLQAEDIEAVPVADFADLHADPQLGHRGHWIRGEHPVLGRRWYERNGYRLPDDRGGFTRTHAPRLGEDNGWLTREILGLSEAEITRLEKSGVIETPSAGAPGIPRGKGRDRS